MQNPSADEIINNWMDDPKRIAHQMIRKYGQPDEMSANMLIWYNNGPWKRTVVRNEGISHNFPMPHTDKLESVIDYRVPPRESVGAR